MQAARRVGTSDVLVIGAGPAGAAAAIALARAGVDVTVVDRAHFPRDKTCGDAVSNGAVELLDELHAGEDVRARPHALVWRGAAIFPDGTRVERGYERPGYFVPRLHLDDCLRRAAERAGAHVLQGVHVAGLRVQDGVVVGAEGPALEWRARIVIAADGHGSVGLPALGCPVKSARHLGLSSTLYCRGVSFPHGPHTADHFFEHDLPCGYAWIFPEVEGVANIGVYLRKDAYERGRSGSLAALLEAFIARHGDRFGAMTRVGKARTWSLPLAPAPWPASAPGLLLAGDAGNFIDPLTGEGIWQALFTGMSAARIAAEALSGPGHLSAELRRRFASELEARVGRPSRAKAAVQDGMRLLVDARLYRLAPVRGLLRLAYARKSFEMTKA